MVISSLLEWPAFASSNATHVTAAIAITPEATAMALFLP